MKRDKMQHKNCTVVNFVSLLLENPRIKV